MSDNSMTDRVKVFVNPKSGSIRITGTVDFVDADGNVTNTMENPKLCGCGLTKDAPFCDSSHKAKNPQ